MLSTDQAHAAKPDPRAYRMGVDALREEVSRMVFIAIADGMPPGRCGSDIQPSG